MPVFWPVLGPLLVGVLALGGVTVEGTFVVALAVLLATAWAAARGDLRTTPLAAVLVALAGFSALQALPLPASVLGVLAPASSQLWSEVSALAPGAGASGRISLDPGSSRLEAVRLASHAAFALVCHGAARRVGSSGMCAAVAALGSMLALTTLGHQLSGAERVFGWYRPQYAGFVAPLMNPNALTGALSLGYFCAAGILLDRRSGEIARSAALGACVLCLATALWLGSRAGVGLLALGCLGLLVHAARQRRKDPDRASSRGLIALAVATALGVSFAAFSLARLERELLDDSLEKLTVIGPALAAARAHWLLGAGRGAFSAAVSPYVATDSGVFDHAEIFVFGWAVEWGLPVLVALLVGLGFGLWPARLARAPTTRVAGYLGVVVVWLHNLADLSLDVPLVAMATIAATAAFLGPDVTRRAPPKRSSIVIVIASVLIASLWLSPIELARTARHRLAQDLARGPLPKAEIEAAVAAHPADGYVLGLRAAVALAERDPNTMRWIDLALERAPGSAPTLLLLADALALQGHVDQALGALRRALAIRPDFADDVARRALAWAPERANAVLPAGRARVEGLVALANRAPVPREALRFFAEAAHLPGAPESTLISAARLALSSSEEDCQSALERSCIDFARQLRASLRGLSPEIVELDAALVADGGDRVRAFEILERGCPRSPAGVGCLRALLGYGGAVPLERHAAAGEAFLLAACGTDDGCAGAEAELGQSLLARGELRLGFLHLVRSATLRPSEAAWRRVGELARDSGELGVLKQAISGLSGLGVAVPEDLSEAVVRLERDRLLPP